MQAVMNRLQRKILRRSCLLVVSEFGRRKSLPRLEIVITENPAHSFTDCCLVVRIMIGIGFPLMASSCSVYKVMLLNAIDP